MKQTIIFAEDEAILGELVREALQREGFTVHWFTNGLDAINAFKQSAPDLLVLDVMMPVLDGFSASTQIRSMNSEVPILFLTARTATTDVVKGFGSGGNDYLRKPFSLEELMLRVRELLRRTSSSADNTGTYSIGRYEFDPARQTLRLDATVHRLTYRESEVLRELVICKNSLLNRKDVLLRLWGDDTAYNARNMDVYITRLRKLLADDASIGIINVRGYGYKLVEQ